MNTRAICPTDGGGRYVGDEPPTTPNYECTCRCFFCHYVAELCTCEEEVHATYDLLEGYA
jgi:hypothetical protein